MEVTVSRVGGGDCKGGGFARGGEGTCLFGLPRFSMPMPKHFLALGCQGIGTYRPLLSHLQGSGWGGFKLTSPQPPLSLPQNDKEGCWGGGGDCGTGQGGSACFEPPQPPYSVSSPIGSKRAVQNLSGAVGRPLRQRLPPLAWVFCQNQKCTNVVQLWNFRFFQPLRLKVLQHQPLLFAAPCGHPMAE